MKNLVGKKLEKIRVDNKLSRRQMLELSGFKERTIISYEKGINPPSSEYIDFISLYFGYTKDSILNNNSDKLVKMDKMVNTLLMYQSIFNYTDEKMAELLAISKDNFLSIIELKTMLNPSKILKIAYALNIYPANLLQFETLEYMDNLFYDYFANKNRSDENKKKINEYLGIPTSLQLDDFIHITPEYYASIIKKRNTPEKITPLNTLSDIPPKHQELLELLKFAPDSFTDEIIKKLKEIKKLQEF